MQPPPQIWLPVFEASTDILRLCNFGSGHCKKSCEKPFQGLLPFAIFIGAAFVVRILSSVFIWAMPHVPGHELWGSQWPRSWTCIPGLTSDWPLCCGHLWWSGLLLTLLTITRHEFFPSLNLILPYTGTTIRQWRPSFLLPPSAPGSPFLMEKREQPPTIAAPCTE